MSETTDTTGATGFRADRFRKLVAAVEAAPPDRFDMGCWCRHGACGTVACACGWYAMSRPELFEIDPANFAIYAIDGTRVAFSSWAKHFGINDGEAEDLFCSDNYLDPDGPTREAVLARLREFLAASEARR